MARRYLPRLGRARLVGIGILGGLILASSLVSILSPYSPLEQDYEMTLSPPSILHPFGTDHLGRDVLTRTIFAARVTLSIALGSAVVAGVLGIAWGLIATEGRQWMDSVVMRLMDFFLATPAIVVAMVLIALAGRSTPTLIAAIGVATMPWFALLTRAGAISEREREYVLAARGFGASRLYVTLRTILPNIMRPLAVQFIVALATGVLLEAGLGFIGLGIPPPNPSWGAMLAESKGLLHQAPWYAICPGLALGATVLAMDLIGSAGASSSPNWPGSR